MDQFDLALRFGSALALGVLLGLERERTKSVERRFAGVRTIGLIALSGARAAYFDQMLGLPWLALLLFAAVGMLVIVSYAVTAARGELGITTEVTALLAFLLGWLCMRDHIALAGGLAVASALVLALKDWLHELAKRIEARDVEATLKFAIVTLIILPLVPNETFGPPPLDVLNPHQVWMMVVLISAVNFISYILVKVVGPEHGLGLSSILAAAAEWRLLGLLFERPRPGWREEITTLASEIHDPALRAAATAATTTTESEYLDVLGPGGVVSPREVGYRGREVPAPSSPTCRPSMPPSPSTRAPRIPPTTWPSKPASRVSCA